MLYVQHWSFKTGYHQKGAEKFLGGGGDYPGVEMIGRYHAPGSLEGFKALVLKTSVSARAPWVRIPPPPFK